jgi:hypothetical protein
MSAVKDTPAGAELVEPVELLAPVEPEAPVVLVALELLPVVELVPVLVVVGAVEVVPPVAVLVGTLLEPVVLPLGASMSGGSSVPAQPTALDSAPPNTKPK